MAKFLSLLKRSVVIRSTPSTLVLPTDLSGKTLLDASCNQGHLCLEAEKRGAKKVVGIDIDAKAIEDAKESSKRTGSKVEFRLQPLQELSPVEKFDFVVFLQRLEFARDPVGALDLLSRITSEQLIFDMPLLGSFSRHGFGLPSILNSVLNIAPTMYVANRGAVNSRELPRFVISPKALRNILLHHRRFFRTFSATASDQTNRIIYVAQKYNFKHTIVVAGPVSSGKSTFCRKLLDNEFPEVWQCLSLPPGERPKTVFLPRARASIPPANGETVLLHYNFLNPYVSAARSFPRDENLDFLYSSQRLSFITILATPQQLVEQITKSEIEGGRFHRPAKRHLLLREEYKDPDRVACHYDRWIRFTDTFPSTHLVVRQENGRTIITSGEKGKREDLV